MATTNYERWLSYTSSLSSPENYIRWAWYFLISSSLQRRVWIGPDHMRRYANIYVILCGDAGLGKGLVIRPVSNILKHHKLADPTNIKFDSITDNADKQLMKDSFLNDYKRAQEMQSGKSVTKHIEKPLLFPVAPDDITYESLAETLAGSIRRINYKQYDEQLKREVLKIYTHTSMAFCLEELSSLFKKHTENVARFFLVTYDCGDYTKKTKTQGTDQVRKCCVSILAGTTPDFMEEILSDRLLNEGFASRTFFIYASKPRKKYFIPPDLTNEQSKYYLDILTHVKGLSELYGRVHVDEDTLNWIQNWLDSEANLRVNSSSRLSSYYARKDNHVAKLAMALHFSNSLEMHIDKICFEEAIAILEEEERNMHCALGIDDSNPLASPARRILNFLVRSGRRTRKQLITEFWGSVPGGVDDIDKIIEYLRSMNKITQVTGEEINGHEQPIYFEAIVNEE